WNGTDENNRNVASGVYFYRMKNGKFSSTKKMILMK
ncbi:T9SS type A sorting domain-containing protein, partial [bacterium]|nr:T9SS type A sorting domain-containing protein [bacterium]MBI9032180.1 T9SS type A sorting domain-containing protein [bacterium]